MLVPEKGKERKLKRNSQKSVIDVNPKPVVTMLNQLASAGLLSRIWESPLEQLVLGPPHLTSHKRVRRAVGGAREIILVHWDTLLYQKNKSVIDVLHLV